MFVLVDQQVVSYGLISGSQVEGEVVGFGILICVVFVFFVGEVFWADVQVFIFVGVSLVQLENIEFDVLLSGYIVFDVYICFFLFIVLGNSLFVQQGLEVFFISFFYCCFVVVYQFFFFIIERGDVGGIFVNDCGFFFFVGQVY